MDRVIAQSARNWFLTAKVQVQSRVIYIVSLQQMEESFGFPPLVTIPPSLHTRLSPPLEVYGSPDQAPHYHTVGTKLGASSVTGTWLVSE
jgi:hypothetical protein